MANKLKAVKIKYGNGTYSEQIPLSVDIGNVVYNSTYSLAQILGNINYANKGSIQTQLTNIYNQSGFLIDENGGVTFIGGGDAINNWLDENAGDMIGFIIDNEGVVRANAGIQNLLTIPDEAITTTKLGNEAITTEKYADRSLTISKIKQLDEKWTLVPTKTYATGYNNSQGMACDDTYIYLTYRSSTNNTVPMNLAKIALSNMETVETGTLTTGHFNSLYYYNNKLYGTGGALKTNSSTEDYYKCAIIDANTLSVTNVKTLPLESWGVGVVTPSNKSPITGVWVASQRMMAFYTGYINANDVSLQYPMTKVYIDYTGCTTIQGSFHMTPRYIYILETTYNAATRLSGHQVVRCCSYSGMIVKSYYLDSITTELEDIYVTSDNSTMYLNDARGNIYKFDLPTLHHSLASGMNVVGSLKPGTIKNVYTNPSPLDVSFKFRNNTYDVYSIFYLNDYAFWSEIADFCVPWLQIHGRRYPGNFDNSATTLRFSGTHIYNNGDSMFFNIEFKRGETERNYFFYLQNVKFVLNVKPVTEEVSSGNNTMIEITSMGESQVYTATSADGDLSDTSTGMGKVFYDLYTTGWIKSNIYVYSLSYICGIRFDWHSLDLIS